MIHSPKSELMKNTLTGLKSASNSQRTLLRTFNKEADTMTEASFVMSWNFACAKWPYFHGESVKKNIVVAMLALNFSD